MSEFTTTLVEDLSTAGGFDQYFADIAYARDLVDPPIRKHTRDKSQLSLRLDYDEYDVTSAVDLENPRLVIEFGYQGLFEVAECIADLTDETVEGHESEKNETSLALDGLRYALLFQASQIFTNNRLKLDEDFLKRFKASMPHDARDTVPYAREAIHFPNGEFRHPTQDRALQYRVCRFASRIALDRIAHLPHSSLLQRTENSGALVITAMRKKLEQEAEGSVVIPEDDHLDKVLAWATYTRFQADDNYPLMWAALANPAPRGVIRTSALPDIGRRSSPRPGWVSVCSFID